MKPFKDGIELLLHIPGLELAFYKARKTRGDLSASALNAIVYTTLYTGWLFAIALIVDLLK
ncbi:MAG: hypothetical protein WBA74_01765 [Cyclobacteriaceae bacterium]